MKKLIIVLEDLQPHRERIVPILEDIFDVIPTGSAGDFRSAHAGLSATDQARLAGAVIDWYGPEDSADPFKRWAVGRKVLEEWMSNTALPAIVWTAYPEEVFPFEKEFAAKFGDRVRWLVKGDDLNVVVLLASWMINGSFPPK